MQRASLWFAAYGDSIFERTTKSMRRTLGIFAVAMAFSVVALAEDWTGKLLDSTCHDRQSQQKGAQPAPAQPGQQTGQSCMATEQTTAFAVQVGANVYKLDAAGNSQAMTALRNRADRAAPGKAPGKAQQSSDITAKVTGTESGGTIKVEKIEVQ